jgi:hypothetical protein
MGTWRSLVKRAFSSGRSGLGDETEAFLAGRYLERTRTLQGDPRVEPWMWLNAVAHGSLDRVQELAVGVRSTGPAGPWCDMRVSVARELEGRCRGDAAELAHLQVTVLVPLEMRLLECRDLTPQQVTDIARLELTAADS